MKDVDKQFNKLKKSFSVYVHQLLLLTESNRSLNKSFCETVKLVKGEKREQARHQLRMSNKKYAASKERFQKRFDTETKKHERGYRIFLCLLEEVAGKEVNGCYHTDHYLDDLESNAELLEQLKALYITRLEANQLN